MKIALGADEGTHLVEEIARYLEERGHSVDRFGAAAARAEPWGRTAIGVAESVARGEHDLGVVCCWTGTGVSIAANKVTGIRAALCGDAATARGARKWNDANVLALSLRATAPEVAREILEAWLAEPYGETEGESLEVIRETEAPRRAATAHSSGGPSRSSAR
jgi:ribose 5-phosphate isomerase B